MANGGPSSVDFSSEAITQAEQRATLFRGVRASFVVADAARTPLPDATADAVVCIDALQMLPERDLVLREIARLLRPGGRVVITTWERDAEGIAGREPIRDSGRLVAASGLDVLIHEEHPEWMARQTEFIRARDRRGQRRSGPGAEALRR